MGKLSLSIPGKNWKKCRLDFVYTISKMTKYQYDGLETKLRTKENANS
jgi:hypothetical protein